MTTQTLNKDNYSETFENVMLEHHYMYIDGNQYRFDRVYHSDKTILTENLFNMETNKPVLSNRIYDIALQNIPKSSGEIFEPKETF